MHQPSAAVLGSRQGQARGRRPTDPGIHLFVRRGLSQRRLLHLSDHADFEYGLLPGLSRRPSAQVRPAEHPSGSRRRPPTIAAVILLFPAISSSSTFRPFRRNSIRRKISGMKSARKSSRITRSNPSAPSAPNSNRPSSTSSAIPHSSDPLPLSSTSSTHSDVELV